MNEIEKADRPEGQKEHYRFYRVIGTGQMWKAKLEFREGRSPFADPDFAPSEFSVVISVSPVDESGAALRDAQGRPIVIDSLTHTFNEVEMSGDDFNVDTRVEAMVADRIVAGEAKLAGVRQLKGFVRNWRGSFAPPIFK